MRTSDPAEMRNALFTAYGANSFDISNSEKFEARANFIQLDDIGVGFCQYGAPTKVGFPAGDFVRLQFGLKGRAEAPLVESIMKLMARLAA